MNLNELVCKNYLSIDKYPLPKTTKKIHTNGYTWKEIEYFICHNFIRIAEKCA